jgi:hypothetical protein
VQNLTKAVTSGPKCDILYFVHFSIYLMYLENHNKIEQFMLRVIKPFCHGSTWQKTDLRTVCADRHLLVTQSTAGRFMSGLTLKSPHCACCTVIHGCVLGSQAVHLQIQLVLVIVSGDGESALHRVCVVRATSTVNCCNPLQPLSWSLTDPAHVIATEGESRGCT